MHKAEQSFEVEQGLACDVRELIAARVWLTHTEKRRLWIFGPVVFTVSGPQAQLEAIAREIAQAVVDLAEARQW